VVQYVQGTATDAPTIAPGPVMHSCPQHQNGGSASLGVWEGWPGVRECWAGAGQELGRPVSAWVPVWVPCTCMNCSQLHASHASRDTDTACLVPRTQARNNVLSFFLLCLFLPPPLTGGRRLGESVWTVDHGRPLVPPRLLLVVRWVRCLLEPLGAVLKEANRAPYKQPAPSWLSG
jgi:hypothetical protein